MDFGKWEGVTGQENPHPLISQLDGCICSLPLGTCSLLTIAATTPLLLLQTRQFIKKILHSGFWKRNSEISSLVASTSLSRFFVDKEVVLPGTSKELYS